jgi:hypothetical protein
MCTDDWKDPYNPTLYELQTTIETLKECYAETEKQLQCAGVQSEMQLLQRLADMEMMYVVLMDYYTID